MISSYTYETYSYADGSKACITGYTGMSTDLKIPAYYVHTNNTGDKKILSVTEVRSLPSNITSLKISRNITDIIINNCDNLTNITFEEIDGCKWQVYESDAWRDAQTSELLDLVKAGKKLKRIVE